MDEDRKIEEILSLMLRRGADLLDAQTRRIIELEAENARLRHLLPYPPPVSGR